jgi:hypothetical protein
MSGWGLAPLEGCLDPKNAKTARPKMLASFDSPGVLRRDALVYAAAAAGREGASVLD